MNIQVDDTKRCIIMYATGQVPKIEMQYYLVNYSKDNTLEEVFDDIDNMTAHLILQQTGTALQMPYCERPIDLQFKNLTPAEKIQRKQEIKQDIDSLLELLKSLD